MSFRAEQRADLRAMQRAVRDNVTVAEARDRIAHDIASYRAPPRRDAPPAQLMRTIIAMTGLGLLFWTVLIVAVVAAGKLVTLLVWSLFAITGYLVVASIARDVRTAIRWWRS